MTPRETFLSRLRREPCAGIPLFLRDLTLALDALHAPTCGVFGPRFDSELSARCVLALQREVGHDAVVGSIHSYSLEAFGGAMRFPADGIPYQSEPPFADLSRMDGRDPSEICDGLLSGMRESYRIVRRERPDLAVVANVGGPVNTAGNLRGMEALLMDAASDPRAAEDVVRFASGIVLSIIDFFKEDCDAVFLACASDNPDMLGPDGYRRYSLPNVAGAVARSHSLGLPAVFHPHGSFSTPDRRALLDDSVATGADGFQFAEGNIPAGILAGTKGRCAILGGVDAFTTLLLGPEERIARDTRAFVRELGAEDYIMTCSCSLHRGLPIANVKAMARELRRSQGGSA